MYLSMKNNKHIPNIATLCYLIDNKNGLILLGKKKYGRAKGKYNGFGGKVEFSDTSIKDSVKREFKEETNMEILDPVLTSIITFRNSNNNDDADEKVHVYVYTSHEWEGKPEESDEMTVEWIAIDSIPYAEMWENDRLWFNTVISGKKSIIQITSNEDKLSTLTIEIKDKLTEELPMQD